MKKIIYVILLLSLSINFAFGGCIDKYLKAPNKDHPLAIIGGAVTVGLILASWATPIPGIVVLPSLLAFFKGASLPAPDITTGFMLAGVTRDSDYVSQKNKKRFSNKIRRTFKRNYPEKYSSYSTEKVKDILVEAEKKSTFCKNEVLLSRKEIVKYVVNRLGAPSLLETPVASIVETERLEGKDFRNIDYVELVNESSQAIFNV